MIRTLARGVDAQVSAQLVADSVQRAGDKHTAVVQVVVRVRRGKGGLGDPVTADVQLGDGNPVTALKAALVDLETQLQLRFEMFEVVDITRQFLAHAQTAGFRIKGFPVAGTVSE